MTSFRMTSKLPSASVLVLDFLAASAGGRMSAQEVCRAGAIMGYSDAAMRVALTRLTRQGKVVKRERGRYALNAKADRLQRDVASWHERVDWLVPWRGDWIAVHDATANRSDKTSLRRHRRALLLRGFRKWKQGLHLRPDNLSGGAAALRSELHDLGLSSGAELFVATAFDARQGAELLRLWNIPALRRGHARLLARARDGGLRLEGLRPETAARESLLVGRELIGAILHDPLLPPDVVGGVRLRELADAIADYQALSRRIWDGVLR